MRKMVGVVVLSVLVIAACSANEGNVPGSGWAMGGKSDDNGLVEKYRELYRGDFSPQQEALHRNRWRRWPVLYLNFGTANRSTTISGGVVDDSANNTSSLVQGTIEIPPFNYRDFLLTNTVLGLPHHERDFKKTLVRVVRELLAPYHVDVTTSRPREDEGPYTMIVIGGDASAFSHLSQRETLGVAPLDCGNKNPRNIGFVFNHWPHSPIKPWPKTALGRAIAHMAGHTYGLAHVDAAGVMNANDFGETWGVGPVIQDAYATCARENDQNSSALLEENLPDDIHEYPLWVCAGGLTNLNCCYGNHAVECRADGTIWMRPCVALACGWHPNDHPGDLYPFKGEYRCALKPENVGRSDPDGKVPMQCPAEALRHLQNPP